MFNADLGNSFVRARYRVCETVYLSSLRVGESLVELKVEHPMCVAELLVQPNGAQNPPPFSLLRVDAMYGSASSPSAVRIAFPVNPISQVAEFEHSGVRVHLGALSWENASVSFDASRFEIAHLGGWLSKWIDDAEVRVTDELGLAGVLHSIAWNSSGGGIWEIIIDFGSAPVECAVELIETLAQHGVSTCYVKSDEDAG